MWPVQGCGSVQRWLKASLCSLCFLCTTRHRPGALQAIRATSWADAAHSAQERTRKVTTSRQETSQQIFLLKFLGFQFWEQILKKSLPFLHSIGAGFIHLFKQLSWNFFCVAISGKQEANRRFGVPLPQGKNLQMPFWLYVPHPFHRWNSQLKRCITPIKPQEPSKMFLKNKLTVRMKYLLVRTALYNCSEGVKLYQAPWKPLLWDWRQKQPGVGSCAAIAKTSMNLHQEASGSELMAQSWWANRSSLGEPQGRKFLLSLAMLPYHSLSSLVPERSKTKRAML